MTKLTGLYLRQISYPLRMYCPVGETKPLLSRIAYSHAWTAWYRFEYLLSCFKIVLGPFCPFLDQTLSCKKHGEVMKILYILRLLSGNPAKSRLLLWLLFSWLSSRAFCKPELWIWENALWPFLWPQSNPLRQVISLSLPKGKNQGPGKLPRISQAGCSLVGGSPAPGHMLSPSIRRALAAWGRACQQPQLTFSWTSYSCSGRRKAQFRKP